MSAILKQKLIDIANGFTKYGLWKGGGSSTLSELTDVTLSNLQANDILKYNGSVWVNDDSLQKQIDTLNSNLRFKQLGIIYASGELSINTNDYSELLFEFLPNANDNFEGASVLFIPSSYNFSIKIYIVLKTGYYIDTNNCASYSISLTATKAQVGNYAHYKNGTNVTKKVRVIIYGKK